MFIEDFLIPISVGLATALILWVINKYKQPINAYFKRRKSLRSIRKWRKAGEKRRAQPGYKTDKELLAEAIREYQETGECTTIPKEVLETLLLMNKPTPIIPFIKSNNNI